MTEKELTRKQKTIKMAKDMIENDLTFNQLSKKYGISQSSCWTWIAYDLQKYDKELYNECQEIIEKHIHRKKKGE